MFSVRSTQYAGSRLRQISSTAATEPNPNEKRMHLGDDLEGVALIVMEGDVVDLGLIAARDHAAVAEELIQPRRDPIVVDAGRGDRRRHEPEPML